MIKEIYQIVVSIYIFAAHLLALNTPSLIKTSPFVTFLDDKIRRNALLCRNLKELF